MLKDLTNLEVVDVFLSFDIGTSEYIEVFILDKDLESIF